MNIRIIRIYEESSKSVYAENVLRKLPEWFGNEKALCDYLANVKSLPFWAAQDAEGNVLGFLAVKIHYGHTGDIYVCGVLPQYQRHGIGRMLMLAADDYFRSCGCRYVIVKTLDETAAYEPYERTRLYYRSVGFEPLITLTEMWDEENPCLIMIKQL